LPAIQAHALVVIPPYVIRTYQGAPSGMAVEVQEDAARGLKEPLTIERIPLARNRIQDDYQPP
jgi:polar amino acid transport system substrate-binding protein